MSNLGNKKIMAKNIRHYMDIAQVNQTEICTTLGIKMPTFSDWVNAKTYPRIDKIELMANYFGISKADLVEEHTTPPAAAKSSATFTDDEIEHIKKYRFISRHSPAGAQTVEYILNREYDVAKQQESTLTKDNVRYISFYNKLASAGTGQILFDDIPMELIAIPDIPQYKRVNYALAVNGGSMEPEFYDGDIILIESTHEIRKGEIGIFVVDNEAYIKELGDQILISLNQEYDNIPLTEYSRCLGRVVGKLEKL